MARIEHGGIVRVAVVETVIFGISGFQACCTQCAWKGAHRDTEKHASADAHRHGKSVITKEKAA